MTGYCIVLLVVTADKNYRIINARVVVIFWFFLLVNGGHGPVEHKTALISFLLRPGPLNHTIMRNEQTILSKEFSFFSPELDVSQLFH
jgi:hypothetical protein